MSKVTVVYSVSQEDFEPSLDKVPLACMAIVTAVPDDVTSVVKIGDVVIQGVKELIFPRSGRQDNRRTLYRVRHLRRGEKVVFEANDE